VKSGVRLLLVALALAAAVAAYWSARLAYAALLYDRATPRSTQRAAALAPGNARYTMGWAQLAEGAGLGPAETESLLHSVLRAHPADSEALIALGLRAEMRGDFTSAQRDLLAASRSDRGYNPRWTLANYYFRRHEGPNFWKWSRAACNMAYEPAPLFRLLWNYTEDGGEILQRAIPDQPALLRQYLYFLISDPHWDAAASTAQRILQQPQPEDTPVLMAWCDRLLAAARGPQALALWNTLARRNLIEFAPIDPARGPVNPAFLTPPTGAGFDWRLAPAPGIEPSLDRPGLRLNFTGDQPEAWEPLWQYAALEPAATYRLAFQYATTAIPPNSGLRWRILDLTAQPSVLAQSECLSHQDWTIESVLFRTPPALRLARLDLSYRRRPGTVRIEGSVRLRNVTLERVN
jgi:hypothetical protein